MEGTLGIVGLIVALIAVIVVHELAHFGVAKAFGIMVTEFFVGWVTTSEVTGAGGMLSTGGPVT